MSEIRKQLYYDIRVTRFAPFFFHWWQIECLHKFHDKDRSVLVIRDNKMCLAEIVLRCYTFGLLDVLRCYTWRRLLFARKYLAFHFSFHCFTNCMYAEFLSMNLNLKMTVERSKRRSYLLSLVFITKSMCCREKEYVLPWKSKLSLRGVRHRRSHP